MNTECVLDNGIGDVLKGTEKRHTGQARMVTERKRSMSEQHLE